MSPAVVFENVSIVFGNKPETALGPMDEGRDREDIKSATGQVLGVHDCSLEVETGEILVLMGLSGSGKSTLIRAVNALNPVTRGAVHINDGTAMVNVTRADERSLREIRQRHVSMVFQQFGLLPWRTVNKNIGFGLELRGFTRGEIDEKVGRQLDLVGLEGWGECKVQELSGGMQQRVGLARALVSEAPILLMDEPFSALDPLIRTRLQDELIELQKKLKRTVIFVSHDLDEAFKIGDRIAIMDGGRIVQWGAPREIYSKPASPYVADFVSNMNPLDVFCAKDMMEPGASGKGIPLTVDADTNIPGIMETFRKAGKSSAGVTENGKVIGKISSDGILARIVGRRN